MGPRGTIERGRVRGLLAALPLGMTLQKPAPWTPPAPVPDVLTTPRLVIRRYRDGDERALNEAITLSRESLLPWLPWAKSSHLTLNETIHDLVRFRRESENLGEHDALVLGVFRRDTGALVGGSGFHTLKRDTHQGEIGYWTDARSRRQGYCTEATRWLISWMLTPQGEALRGADGREVPGWGFRRVEILCAGGNAASEGVPRKIGLRLEQRRVLDRWVDGVGWQDTLSWGILREEWDRDGHGVRG